eukprot:3940294-Rhodomonas_salina.1
MSSNALSTTRTGLRLERTPIFVPVLEGVPMSGRAKAWRYTRRYVLEPTLVLCERVNAQADSEYT